MDTNGYPRLSFSVVLPRESSTPPRLFEDGRRVPILFASNVGAASTEAIAVVHSPSMRGQAFRTAIEVAERLVADKRPGQRIAVFSIGRRAIQLTAFSRTTRTAEEALADIRVDRRYGTALKDGVVLAAQALGREPGRDKALLLLTNGVDTTSQSLNSAAMAAVSARKVSLYPIMVRGRSNAPGFLETLARGTGNAFLGQLRGSPRNYVGIADDIRKTWRMDYLTSARPGATVTVRIAQAGSPPLVTRVTMPGGSRKFLSRTAILAIVLAAAIAIVLLARRLSGDRTRRGSTPPRRH